MQEQTREEQINQRTLRIINKISNTTIYMYEIKKIQCPHCFKIVIYNNMVKHQLTKKCQQKQQKIILITQRNILETFNEPE